MMRMSKTTKLFSVAGCTHQSGHQTVLLNVMLPTTSFHGAHCPQLLQASGETPAQYAGSGEENLLWKLIKEIKETCGNFRTMTSLF